MPATTDPDAWVMHAVETYEEPLLRYASRLLEDFDLAADAVQHAFVKLCGESRERLDGHVAPWLFRVCRNRAFDHLRRAGREQAWADVGSAGTDIVAGLADGDADPAMRAERSDFVGLLQSLLAELPAPQRESIDLWCEGFSYREIAEVTGRREGHVRVLAHRGLTSLRRHPRVRDALAGERPATSAPPSATR